MHKLIQPLALAVMMATGTVIDQNTLLPIGVFVGSMVAAFWVGRKLQRIEDRLKSGDEKFATLGEELTAIHREAQAATQASTIATAAAANLAAANLAAARREKSS